jgi:mannose/fructose/N-acetylgalactosamine-specific phosphotransferase system component IIC
VSEILLLAVVGGLLALDNTSVGQIMVSRPMVVGLVTGWIVGTPAAGFALGTILEVYLLVSFPVGGTRFPEGAPATVVAVATASWSTLPGAFPIGVAMGLVWGQIGGLSITGMRFLNARLAPEAEDRITVRRVVTIHLTGIVLDFVRAAVVTGGGLLAGRVVVTHLAHTWTLDHLATRGMVLLGAVVSLGILLRSFGGLRYRYSLLAAGGVFAGLLVGWLL